MYRVKFKIGTTEHEIKVITESMLTHIRRTGMSVDKDFNLIEKPSQTAWEVWPHMITSVEKE